MSNRISNLKTAPRHKAGTAAPAHAQTHAAANTPPRPAWILSSPIALMVRHHRPFYGSTLRTVSTGERIETGWWDGKTVIRDYFVAQADDHCCYWIFLERDVAPEDDEEPRWFLHGLFG
jgi:protein ImuB